MALIVMLSVTPTHVVKVLRGTAVKTTRSMLIFVAMPPEQQASRAEAGMVVSVAVVALVVVVSIARLCLALVDVVIRIVMVAGTPSVAAEYGSAIETND